MRILLIYLEPLKNDPIGLLCIGTALKEKRHQIKIIGWERKTQEKGVLKEALSFKPEVAGISTSTAVFGKAQSAAKILKENFPDITVIAGGPHPTIAPYDTLKNQYIDICVMGEGEITIVDLLETIEAGGPLERVKGISFLKNEGLMSTKKREYIDDLDKLPFVDRELLPKRIIYGRAGYPLGNPCMLMSTSRGCPYQCSFCQPTLNKMFGNKIRRRSPENVVEEMLTLKEKYGIRGFSFNDDTFLFDNKWVGEFSDLLIGKDARILWSANGRLNKPNRQLLIKMRDSGCAGLVMTPETGSERVRNEILNKNITDQEVYEAYKICHEIGIPAQANIMLGTPTETEQDLELSLAMIKKIQPHFMNLSYTTALPGTYMFEKYHDEIAASAYYKDYGAYDIGEFKKLKCGISDSRLRNARGFFTRFYASTSFRNRARHFIRFPYFRRILFKRWRTLLFSRHPNFKHLAFDIAAILVGSVMYAVSKTVYEADR